MSRPGTEAPGELFRAFADGPSRGLMGNQVVDVGQVDASFAETSATSGHVLDRHLLQLPGLGVHLGARAHGAGEGEEPAVLGEGGEADESMPGAPSGARSTMTAAPASPSVSDESCLLSTERTCFAAFQLRWEMYSPETTMPHLISPRVTRSCRRNTPVSMPAHAFERSKFTACVAPIACWIYRPSGGSKVCAAPPLDRVMLVLITISMFAPRAANEPGGRGQPRRRGCSGSRPARRRGVRGSRSVAPAVCACCVSSGSSALWSSACATAASCRRSRSGTPRRRGAGRLECHPMIRLLLLGFSHRCSSLGRSRTSPMQDVLRWMPPDQGQRDAPQAIRPRDGAPIHDRTPAITGCRPYSHRQPARPAPGRPG